MISVPRLVQASTGAVLLFLVAALVVAAQPAPPGEIVAAGLDHPRGLAVDGNDVLIAELGHGHIVRLSPDGTRQVVVSGLPSATFFMEELGGEELAGPSDVVRVPGGYVVAISELPGDSDFQSLYFADGAGTVVKIADLGAYEAEHNTDGGTDITGAPELNSNPYSIVSDGQGGFFVSDAGANAVLRVNAAGEISPYAIFPNIPNPLFGTVGGPTMQQVPTGIAIGPDGALYVATLTGFPFPPGGATIYRIVGGTPTVYATGLTAVTDIAFDAAGNLYATVFSANMLGENVPGQLMRVAPGGGTATVVVDGLITPTSVTVTGAGRVLVSQEFAGLVSDVTDAIDATPAPTPTATPTPTPDATPPSAPPPASTGQGGTSAGATVPAALALLLAGVAAIVVAGARQATAARKID